MKIQHLLATPKTFFKNETLFFYHRTQSDARMDNLLLLIAYGNN